MKIDLGVKPGSLAPGCEGVKTLSNGNSSQPDFIKEMLSFDQRCQVIELSIQARELWRNIFMLHNNAGWPDEITTSNQRLMGRSGIQNEKSFIKYRDELINHGFIEYRKGKKGQPGKYRLKSLLTFKSTVNNDLSVKFTVNPTVNATVNPTVNATVNTTVNPTDIYKLNEKKENKTESPNGDIVLGAAESDSTPEVIRLLLNDKTEHVVHQSEVDGWSELYPAVDVIQELRKMKGWLDANPTKRKTRKGISKFINGWLSREQDRGGRRTANSSNAKDAIPEYKAPEGNPFKI